MYAEEKIKTEFTKKAIEKSGNASSRKPMAKRTKTEFTTESLYLVCDVFSKSGTYFHSRPKLSIENEVIEG